MKTVDDITRRLQGLETVTIIDEPRTQGKIPCIVVTWSNGESIRYPYNFTSLRERPIVLADARRVAAFGKTHVIDKTL